MKAIITILSGITETSMPYNEFILYRLSHFAGEERHILIVCGSKPNGYIAPEGLEVYFVKRNLIQIRKLIKDIIKRLKEANIPYAIHLHQLKSATLAQLAMLGTGYRQKTLFTIHNTFSGYSLLNKIQSFFNGVMAHIVSCVSNASYDNYPSCIKRRKGARMKAIQNGVDTERIDSILTPTDKKSSLVYFTYVARFVPVKNHGFLVDVIKNAPSNARFVLIGKEENDHATRKKIEQNGLSDKVIITGLIPRREVFQWLNKTDIYISTSTVEGLPISVLEGMYVGMPAILSNITQHKEIVEGEPFASIIPLDLNQWDNEIKRFASMSAEERTELGKKSREYVAAHFSLKSMHEKYSALYNQLQNL